jgi:hypothetical protein
MKRLALLLSLPLFLCANDYFGDVPVGFSAKILSKTTELTLEEFGQMEVEVTYPCDFQMKEIDLSQVEGELSMHYNFAKSSSPQEIEEHATQTISIQYEPKIEGVHYLHLPLIQFESKQEPKSLHTLYPPSIECEVRMSNKESLDELEVASPLGLDPTPPIELDNYNKKVFFNESDNELKEVHQKFLSQAPTMKWKWFAWSFVIGFAAYKLYQLLTRRRSLHNLFFNKVDPREKALKALRELKGKNLPKKGQYDAFYVEITQIVRHYIEGYYKIKAPEQTTQEFLKVMLGQSVFNDKINTYLSDFLKFADLVKFAKFNPNTEDCLQAQDAAESFILSEHEK